MKKKTKQNKNRQIKIYRKRTEKGVSKIKTKNFTLIKKKKKIQNSNGETKKKKKRKPG